MMPNTMAGHCWLSGLQSHVARLHWDSCQPTSPHPSPLRKTVSVKCQMFTLIKTCWVSESNQTASGWYRIQAELKVLEPLLWLLGPWLRSFCTPPSSRLCTNAICHQELKTPSFHTKLYLTSSRLHFRVLRATQLLHLFLRLDLLF